MEGPRLFRERVAIPPSITAGSFGFVPPPFASHGGGLPACAGVGCGVDPLEAFAGGVVFVEERHVERVFEVGAADASLAAHAQSYPTGEDAGDAAGETVQPGPLPRVERMNGHTTRLEHMFDKTT